MQFGSAVPGAVRGAVQGARGHAVWDALWGAVGGVRDGAGGCTIVGMFFAIWGLCWCNYLCIHVRTCIYIYTWVRGPQVLVHVSIYQGSVLAYWVPIFDPRPICFPFKEPSLRPLPSFPLIDMAPNKGVRGPSHGCLLLVGKCMTGRSLNTVELQGGILTGCCQGWYISVYVCMYI